MLSTPFRRARLLSRRAATGAALVLAAMAAGACGDDDITGDDDEPKIQSVRLTVTPPGGGTATPFNVTTTSNTPVQLRVGTSTVTAQALDAAGQPITFDEPFQFRMVANVTGDEAGDEAPLTGVLSFTPGQNGTGTLSGTVTASTVVAATDAWVRLVHVEEAHSDYDAPVRITVVP